MNAIDRTASIMKAVAMMHEAHLILDRVAKLPALPELLRLQAESASRLAGITLHRCTGHHAAPSEAEQMRADLEVLARRIVDPLVASIGKQAVENFHGIDSASFKDALLNALEGSDALGDLSRAAEKAREDALEAAFDYAHPGSHHHHDK